MPNRQDTNKTSRTKLLLSVVFITFSLLSSSCSKNEQPVEENVQTQAPLTETSQATLSLVDTFSTPVEIPNPTATEIPANTCTEKRGDLTRSFITSKVLPGRLYYSIYLPPCYSTEQQYPVLYLLHGKSYQDDQWIRLGLPDIMNRKITNGEMPPFIVVMPYDPGWEDPAAGKYDKAISETLVKWIDSQYSVKTGRQYRAIGGVSRGSGWAFHAAVKYPNLYSIVGIHSPAFFRTDRRNMETILSSLPRKHPIRFLVDVGLQDPELNYSTKFEEYLTEFSIDHSWNVVEGTHSEAYWRSNLEMYLDLYSRDW